MKVRTLTLKNFRGFEDLSLDFSDGLTVLVGENGAGKSSVLDALAIMLSWCGARILSGDGVGRALKDPDIFNRADIASIGLSLEYFQSECRWSYVLSKPGRTNGSGSDSAGLALLSDAIRQRITDTDAQCSVPVLAHYSANRSVDSVSVRPPESAQCFDMLEIYRDNFPVAANFKSFFEWFRAREDLENEKKIESGEPGITVDRDLSAVKQSLRQFLPDFDKFTVRRTEAAMVAEKNGQTIRVDRMSDGEKCLIALVGDLARRLSLGNPTLESPLQGEGIVLIDEIEQHLHPAWQRSVIGNLRRVFPNVQFIVSTHSPQVLGEVAHENIRCLYVDEDAGQQVYTPARSLGLDSNALLEEIFHASPRNHDTADKLRAIFDQIARDDFEAARHSVDTLEGELGGDIPELLKAKTMITMLEGSGAEH